MGPRSAHRIHAPARLPPPPPAFGTFRGLFARRDAAALEAALARWVAHLLGDRDAGALRAVALDGKALRGSLAAHAAAVHLPAAMAQATGCVPGQLAVDAKTNEHKAALELFVGLVLRGRIITCDALSCQRDLSRQVLAAGGHYPWKVDDIGVTRLVDFRPCCAAAIEAS